MQKSLNLNLPAAGANGRGVPSLEQVRREQWEKREESAVRVATLEPAAVKGAAVESSALELAKQEAAAREATTVEAAAQKAEREKVATAETPAVEATEVEPPSRVCLTKPTREQMYPAGTEILLDMPEQFFSSRKMEHPAIPALWISSEQRRYKQRLKYLENGKSCVETGQEVMARLRWKKPGQAGT